jgi:ABC-type multidrug transport system fused ATPase/permease subunit
VLLIEITKLQSNVTALIMSTKHTVRIIAFLLTILSLSAHIAAIVTLFVPIAFAVAASRGARIERVQDALQFQENEFEAVLSESIGSVATRKVRDDVT